MSREVAHINAWLSVGNLDACPLTDAEYVIHIFRSDHPGQERACVHEGRHNLRMDYRDGEEIDPSNLHNLDAFTRRLLALREIGGTVPPTLVHCHAGMCRSPTVAIYLLCVLEGMNPYDAHHLVTKAVYEQRQDVCNVVYRPFRQIVRLWEGET